MPRMYLSSPVDFYFNRVIVRMIRFERIFNPHLENLT